MYNDEIWWTRVPAAMKRINDAKTALKNWQSVAIEGDVFPWRESFTRIVIDQLNSEEPNIYYCTLDLSNLQDSSAIIDEIAEQLCIGYNKKRTIMSLRPELPETGIIWELLNVNNEHLSDIEKLIIQISECDAHIAFLFAKPQRVRIKRCCEIGFHPIKIDLQYYAWTLLMGKLPDHMLEYASFFAVELSGGQPEQCASLCEDIHNCLTNPDVYCNWLTGSQLVSGIHVAQVRGIEPYIEYGRFRLIETLGTRMNAILPFTDEYNVFFSKPIEVELRHMVFYRVELQLADNEKEILSILGIKRALEKQGVKTPTGKDIWPKRTIETILSNRKYIGESEVYKTYCAEYPDRKRIRNQGERSVFVAEGHHTPIITRSMYDEVQEEKLRRTNVTFNEDGTIKRRSTHYSSRLTRNNIDHEVD